MYMLASYIICRSRLALEFRIELDPQHIMQLNCFNELVVDVVKIFSEFLNALIVLSAILCRGGYISTPCLFCRLSGSCPTNSTGEDLERRKLKNG